MFNKVFFTICLSLWSCAAFAAVEGQNFFEAGVVHDTLSDKSEGNTQFFRINGRTLPVLSLGAEASQKQIFGDQGTFVSAFFTLDIAKDIYVSGAAGSATQTTTVWPKSTAFLSLSKKWLEGEYFLTAFGAGQNSYFTGSKDVFYIGELILYLPLGFVAQGGIRHTTNNPGDHQGQRLYAVLDAKLNEGAHIILRYDSGKEAYGLTSDKTYTFNFNSRVMSAQLRFLVSESLGIILGYESYRGDYFDRDTTTAAFLYNF